jgi:hypothetical protein
MESYNASISTIIFLHSQLLEAFADNDFDKVNLIKKLMNNAITQALDLRTKNKK